MKRLLLSQGRTGSLNLTRYVRESNLDTIVYREPFNTTAIRDTGIEHQFKKIISNPNIFVENKIGNDSFPIELQHLNTDELITLLKSKFDIAAKKTADGIRRKVFNHGWTLINTVLRKDFLVTNLMNRLPVATVWPSCPSVSIRG